MLIMQTGDLVDRFTILVLKVVHSGEYPTDALLAEIKEYCDVYSTLSCSEVDSVFFRLLWINSKIWELESAIRQGKEGQLTLEEIGKRALKIRDYNRLRVEAKNALSKYKEIKIDHASQSVIDWEKNS
jgi:hypothetical protein